MKKQNKPKLKIHRYVVTVTRPRGKALETKYFYAKNLTQVRGYLRVAPKGSLVATFLAKHIFMDYLVK